MDYPLPVIKEMVHRVTGVFKSKVDIDTAYMRIALREEDAHKTSIIVEPISDHLNLQ